MIFKYELRLNTPFIIRLKVEILCVLFLTQPVCMSQTKTHETPTSKRMRNGAQS